MSKVRKFNFHSNTWFFFAQSNVFIEYKSAFIGLFGFVKLKNKKIF